MSTLHNKLQASPLLARVLPFVVFLVLTSAQGSFGPDSQFWVYLLKTLVGVWMIWTIWPLVGELRWSLSGTITSSKAVSRRLLFFSIDRQGPGETAWTCIAKDRDGFLSAEQISSLAEGLPVGAHASVVGYPEVAPAAAG